MSQLSPKTQPVTRNTNGQQLVLKLAGAAHQRVREFKLMLSWLIFDCTTFNIFNCFEAHHHLFRLLHNSVRTCLSAKQVVMGGWWVVQKCRPVRSIGGLLFSCQPISFLHHSQPLNAWKREFSVFSVWCVSFIVKINLFGTGRSQCQCIHRRDAFGLNG